MLDRIWPFSVIAQRRRLEFFRLHLGSGRAVREMWQREKADAAWRKAEIDGIMGTRYPCVTLRASAGAVNYTPSRITPRMMGLALDDIDECF